MQIITSNQQIAPKTALAPTKATVVSAQPEEQAELPKDSFGSTVKREALGEARDLSRRVSNMTAGAGGIIGASAGAWTGMVGGAMVGVAAGGAVAAPISSILSNGGWDFIKTGFQTVGTAGQIGMAVGATALAVGGWVVGSKVGEVAGAPLPYAFGLGTGAVKGTLRHLGQEAGALPPKAPEPKPPAAPPSVSNDSFLVKNAGRALGGFGLLAGAAGGGTVGALLGTGAEVVSGLVSGDLGLSAVTRAGLIYGGIGATAGAVTGMVGGMALAKGVQSAVSGVVDGTRMSRHWLELEKKDSLMNDLERRLVTNESDFGKEQQAGNANIAQREQALGSRQEKLTEQRTVLNETISNEQGLTSGRSDQLYTQKTQDLNAYEGKLDGTKAHLDSENSRLQTKESSLETLIRDEATARRENHQNTNQAKYDSRKTGLENREVDLQGQEKRIDQTAENQAQAELQPLRDETAKANRQANDARNDASRLRSETSQIEAAIPGIISEANRYESRASSQEGTNSGLRIEAGRLSSRESSLSSELSSCQRDRDAAKRRRQEEERRRREQSNHGGGGGSSSPPRRGGSNYGGGSGSNNGRRSGSKY